MRLECLELGWVAAEASRPTVFAECMPPGLIELALIHTGDCGAALDARRLEWLIALAKVLKTESSALHTLKLSKDRANGVAKQIDIAAIRRMEDAWNEVDVVVIWN